VNADFFSFKTGWPVNNQVQNGRIVLGTQTKRSHLIIDSDNKPHIERTSFDGWAKTSGGTTFAIAGVNDTHSPNALVLHTMYSDSATSSSENGTIVVLKFLSPCEHVCDTLLMVVDSAKIDNLGQIPKGKSALWIGNGPSSRKAASEIAVGDTLRVYVGIRPLIKGARTILGGVGTIVRGGKAVSDSINVEEKTNFNFLTTRHPRTFVGFDKDSTKLFVCVVDGRQQRSIGMNFHEMADFLVSIGVWNAMNFDGGGSTTMVVRGAIVNSPSDTTGERPVANTLQIIDTAPVVRIHQAP